MTLRPEEMKPFDGSDPYEACADMFRRQQAEIALAAMNMPLYRKIEGFKQLEAYLTGSITGILGVAFSHVAKADHDEIVNWLIDYLPQARIQTEAIFADGEPTAPSRPFTKQEADLADQVGMPDRDGETGGKK